MNNNIKVINELMKEDHRIKLIKKYRNGGTLYTKTKSVLNVKGKYVIRLDHDNLYANKKAFINIYDLNWTLTDLSVNLGDFVRKPSIKYQKPVNFEKMLEYSRLLS